MLILRAESLSGHSGRLMTVPPKYFPVTDERGRLFSITDIHGCLPHLKALISKINPKPEDTIVFLGDYVDRGVDSKGVIDFIMSLRDTCNVITLVGNHDLMMLEAFCSEDLHRKHNVTAMWLRNGGYETLKSYGLGVEDLHRGRLPHDVLLHLEFIKGLDWWYETEEYIFVHATPKPEEEMAEQSEQNLVWRRPSKADVFAKHISGKVVVCGHTAQASGTPSWLSDYYLLTDTGCFFTGVLSAVEYFGGREIDVISFSNGELDSE